MSQNKKECTSKKFGGPIPASSVGDIQKGIVSGSNVQQAKRQIPTPKDQ
ncbi:MAG: hypothetical protein NWF04_03710 [Candidatus Bathyarchaeota archaeon]|nr:hypothetical protein [Candidatus Bathyarchaeota archaeon]